MRGKGVLLLLFVCLRQGWYHVWLLRVWQSSVFLSEDKKNFNQNAPGSSLMCFLSIVLANICLLDTEEHWGKTGQTELFISHVFN